MLYSYLTVNNFLQQIASKLGVRFGATKTYCKWVEVLTQIEALRRQASLSGINYVLFVATIAQAKKYLDQKDKESFFGKTFDSDERHQYLDLLFEWCINYFNRLKSINPYLFSGIQAPVKAGNAKKMLPPVPGKQAPQTGTVQSEMVCQGENLVNRFFMNVDKKFTQMIREKKVEDFINSESFKKLKKYQSNVLTTDLRNHTYLCGFLDLTVDKAPVLKKLIDDLETVTTMGEVHQQLRKFYSGKDNLSSNPTSYQILNSGQNITTRILGFWGLKTTTIFLIDELAANIKLPTSNFRI